MLSIKGLKWLQSVNYDDKTHEERWILLKAAKIAYPEDKKEE